MKKMDLSKYIRYLIDNDEIHFDPEWFDSIELDSDEKEYLGGIKEKRIIELDKALKRTTKVKECLDEPLKAQTLHQFFEYFIEWNNLSIDQMCQRLSVNRKHLNVLSDIKNRITTIPVGVMKSIINFMTLSFDDALLLIKGSYKLTALQPYYGEQLSRYHKGESDDKGSSIKNAGHELLLKSSKANAISSDELNDYLDKLKREFEK